MVFGWRLYTRILYYTLTISIWPRSFYPISVADISGYSLTVCGFKENVYLLCHLVAKEYEIFFKNKIKRIAIKNIAINLYGHYC